LNPKWSEPQPDKSSTVKEPLEKTYFKCFYVQSKLDWAYPAVFTTKKVQPWKGFALTRAGVKVKSKPIDLLANVGSLATLSALTCKPD
jgi:hypothetical protein